MDKYTLPNNVVIIVLACSSVWFFVKYAMTNNRVLGWLSLAYGCVSLGFSWVFTMAPDQLSWMLCTIICSVPLFIAMLFNWMEREMSHLPPNEDPPLPGIML